MAISGDNIRILYGTTRSINWWKTLK